MRSIDLGQRGVHAVKSKVSFINPKGKHFVPFPVMHTKVGSELPLYKTSALMKIGDTGISKTSSPMGNDRSPGSQHNVWRYHN